MRKTLLTETVLAGVGLHGGKPVTMTLNPARAGAGILFCRTDLPKGRATIPARYDLVSDTRLCTRLTTASGASVGTVEHVMAALAGCGVTDALIEIDGDEVPIMDGSAAVFVEAIRAAGLRDLGGPLRAIRILRAVSVTRGEKVATLLPAPRFSMQFGITFAQSAIGSQDLSLALTGDSFARDLADCRTFGMVNEIEMLRTMGLARGGSLENAIVVDGDRVLNPEGLRRPDEFVRHKMLDAVGDLALAGAPIIGRYEGIRAGHEMTNFLLRALFATPEAWDWVDARPGQVAGLPASVPAAERHRVAV